MELENESIIQLYHWMDIEEFEKCGRLLINKGLYSIDFSNVNKGFIEQYDTGQRLGCTFPSPRGNIFFIHILKNQKVIHLLRILLRLQNFLIRRRILNQLVLLEHFGEFGIFANNMVIVH